MPKYPQRSHLQEEGFIRAQGSVSSSWQEAVRTGASPVSGLGVCLLRPVKSLQKQGRLFLSGPSSFSLFIRFGTPGDGAVDPDSGHAPAVAIKPHALLGETGKTISQED